MMKHSGLYLISFSAAVIAVPAVAGEVNGSTRNPKNDFANGRSLCDYSGLNDYPDGSQSGPPGKTQNYGQWVTLGLSDPSSADDRDSFFFPGTGCNPSAQQSSTPSGGGQ